MITNQQIPVSQNPITALWSPWLISGFALVVVCFFLLIFLQDDLWENWRGYVSKNILNSDYVQVENQPITEQYTVKSVKLSKPGFVEILYADWYISPGDADFGHSAFLPAGEYKNIPINVVFPLQIQGAEAWQSIGYATIFYDNGDEIFNVNEDIPVKDKLGDPIKSKIHIRL